MLIWNSCSTIQKNVDDKSEEELIKELEDFLDE